MPDLEDRLSAALRSVAGDAPDAAGLAGAARSRATRRRRTTAGVIAASVAVVGVVAGTMVLGSRDGGTRVADDSTSPTATPIGKPVRYESWRDIQVMVPTDWGYGPLSTWCINGKKAPGQPVVERGGGVVATIACDPLNGYGVQFSDGATFDADEPPGKLWQYSGGDVQTYPEGAWLGYQRTDDAMVLVVSPDRKSAEYVLSSFQQVTDLDVNGCPARLPRAAGPVAGGSVRLCRFTEDGWLEQSETLTGESAAEAVAALDAATRRDPRNCPVSADLVMVRVSSANASADVHWQGCTGVFGWGDVERDLTADVLYWVLSPGWSGGVEGDVPMPDQLRQ